ncbi:MAG: pyrimidine 5'-nucleotidase [Alphaproteobacteria bacterium]|nr:pyrimidine 5'-nucleotidase [Alphaproteobacteria bacterium]
MTRPLPLEPDPAPDFTHVEAWVFDLDNTLYPPSCNLFAQIDAKMRGFICKLLNVGPDEAYRVQKEYYRGHGTTLAGLMKLHNVNPDDFLSVVHDIDVTVIPPNPALAKALASLPGRRLVFTNGTVAHATRVLNQIGVQDHVEEIFDIVHAEFVPKPHVATYERFLRTHGVEPGRAAMFEDLDRNLEPAHALGMTTVLVRADDGHADPAVRSWGEAGPDAPHVHYRTQDLAAFLSTIRLRNTT